MKYMQSINYLLNCGALITLFDKKTESELDFSGVDKEKIDLVCGGDYLKNGIKGFDFIIRSPGVYPFTSEIVDAQKEGLGDSWGNLPLSVGKEETVEGEEEATAQPGHDLQGASKLLSLAPEFHQILRGRCEEPSTQIPSAPERSRGIR